MFNRYWYVEGRCEKKVLAKTEKRGNGERREIAAGEGKRGAYVKSKVISSKLDLRWQFYKSGCQVDTCDPLILVDFLF